MVEILITLGIFIVILAMGIPIYGQWQSSTQLDAATADTKQLITQARTRAMAGINNYSHGVYFKTDEEQVVLYQGSSYASRDNTYDQTLNLPDTIDLVTDIDQSDVNFLRYQGVPTATGSINLVDINLNQSSLLMINFLGLVY